ncbi:MAG TPA: putative Se/S carrier-like protein [Caproicibacter sp.]|nr:putative Se/S carrier-like protein [Caproicibacter sp.]
MGKPMIVVGSVTYAMKGRDILARYGINSSVERVSRGTNGHGCGYGIYVPQRTDEAERILRNSGVPVSGRTDREASL